MVKFLIVTAGWNCGPFVGRCFQSFKNQTYQNFNVVAIDDSSLDDTFKQMGDHMGWGFVCHRNPKSKGGGYNYMNAPEIHAGDYDIICFVGLDDWLEPNALELTLKQHEAGKIHTYSAYKDSDNFIYTDLFYSDEIHAARNYRSDKYRCTGLVSCTKELFEAVKIPDQCEDEKNIYYNLELSMQLLELTGKDRLGVITEPVYNYNNSRKDNTRIRFGRNLAVYNKIMSRPKRELL